MGDRAQRTVSSGNGRKSLVSCPIALYPATSEREKVRFHQINSKTGNRVKMARVDAETGEPVEWDDIVKGYEVGKRQYLEVIDEELEVIAIESTRTIEIDQFVPRTRSTISITCARIMIISPRKVRSERMRSP
jgi:DNA end-binding protein Ku